MFHKKDGGDDIDATHTMDIYARAEIVSKNDKNKGYLTLKDIDSLSTNSECKSELYKFIRFMAELVLVWLRKRA